LQLSTSAIDTLGCSELLQHLTAEDIRQLIGALEGKPAGKMRSRSYALARSGRTLVEALDAAGVRSRDAFDGRVPVMTTEEMNRTLTLSDEDLAALKAACEAAWAQLLTVPG
jgi:hypothetical protein